MRRYYASNMWETAINMVGGLGDAAGDTSLVVADATGRPAVPFKVTVDEEIMNVTAASSNTFTVQRGQEGTDRVAHTDGTAVENRGTAGAWNDLWSEVDDKVNPDGYYPSLQAAGTTKYQVGLGEVTNHKQAKEADFYDHTGSVHIHGGNAHVTLDSNPNPLLYADGQLVFAPVDSGSNANGHWVRYADGTQMCWHATTLNNADTSVLSRVWTFPKPFWGQVHFAWHTPIMAEGSFNPGAADVHAETYSYTGSVSVNFALRRRSGVANFVSGNLCPTRTFAIGRWK